MENKKTASNFGLILHILISLVLIAVGCLMIFIKSPIINNILYEYSVYGVVAAAAVTGIAFIVRYFVKDEYKHISNYGFTKGVFLVVVSAALMVNATEAASYIDIFFNCLALVIGTIIFQEALSMKYMKNSAWGLALFMALVIIAASIVMIMNVNNFVSTKSIVYYGYLIASGALSLVSLLMNLFSAKKDFKNNQTLPETNNESVLSVESDNVNADFNTVTDNDNY
ncbi:MAG: hypothetical protein HUJ70_11560 [Pseudobutyrivibrio sp.]|nr:hypothetical protein [Pseudobutyrivibrio sp.]